MRNSRLWMSGVLALSLGIIGCEVLAPEIQLGNRPPTTTITLGPPAGGTVNHHVVFRWAGNDEDGDVIGFRVFVDGNLVSVTTRSDTSIVYGAPLDSVPVLHSFAVVAVDNDGLVDPSPESRSFFTLNIAPSVSFFIQEGGTETVPPNSVVSRGFKVKLMASDSNRTGIEYSVAVDDTTPWSDWTADSLFLVAHSDIIADSTTFPPEATGVPGENLTRGSHTFYARARDAGGALSAVISLPFIVADSLRPVMDPTRTVAVYGTQDFYPDGSVYYRQVSNLSTKIVVVATGSAYFGQINAYRYQMADTGEWSPWGAKSEVEVVDLQPGEYLFRFVARDLAGALSDTLEYRVRIVEQQLTTRILLVDETYNNPRPVPGLPGDPEVDAFYDSVLVDYEVDTLDYGRHVDVVGEGYVSPYDLRNVGVVFWHADDFRAQGQQLVDRNMRVLGEFLGRGGRLVVSGWDLMLPFGVDNTGLHAEYAVSRHGEVDVLADFPYATLRCIAADRDTLRRSTGFVGVGDFPGIRIDPAKLPPSYRGAVERAWVFLPRGECRIIGQLSVLGDSLSNPYRNRPAAYLYDQSFRVAVIGLPLYFCRTDDVKQFLDALMPRMFEGLGPQF